MHAAIQTFFKEEGYQLVEEVKADRVFVLDGGPMNRRVILKIDFLDSEHRPGKPKGIAKGEAHAESVRMEQVFAVMKDYRFFKLCLPAVYGMGRYREDFDWIVFKWYDGARFAWSEKESGEALLGGHAVPVSSAKAIAMVVFDLTQVPVLKFSKKVPTRNYPAHVEQLRASAGLAAAVKKGYVTQERVDVLLGEWITFFDRKVPTIYTIQNGDFYPRNMLQLSESIVLLDWDSAVISTVEEVIAYEYLLMWGNLEWQKKFLAEVEYLMDVNQEWLAQMMTFRALHQLAFWAGFEGQEEKELKPAIQAMVDYLR